jgi:hypothetical protein
MEDLQTDRPAAQGNRNRHLECAGVNVFTLRGKSSVIPPKRILAEREGFEPVPLYWLQSETRGAFAPVSPLFHPDLCTDLCTAPGNGVASTGASRYQ